MRAGKIAVIGRANAGKSTLINVLVGEKVSIVSPKPQTTRDRILGVLTEDDCQLVFVDTPGLYKNTTYLTDVMMKTTEHSARDVDLIMFVHDGHAGVTDADTELMKKYVSGPVPAMVVYTKTDIMQKEKIPLDIAKMYDAGVRCDVFPVSARRGSNMKKLKEALVAAMPEGEKVIEEDIVSDRSERFMLAEIMREKILLKFEHEIPYGIAIVVNTFELGENGVYEVNLDIVCEKKSHKAILIGKQGAAIKEVSAYARQDMEKFLGAKVYLTTYVRVKEDWRNNPSSVKEFGYGTDR
ncbi:MAG: GTPase Era [Clostridia bacterium]|nr:GTPase Era [Clostridia bacterium]